MMMIQVRVADPAGNQVVLWERHPDHPGGEIFLTGEGEFEVAETAAVGARLRDGRLVLVEPAVAAAAKAEPEPMKPEAVAPEVIDPAPVAARAEASVPSSAKRPPRRGGL